MVFVQWESKYVLGIRIIDEQHKYLFDLTNELYEKCHLGENAVHDQFIKTLHMMVKYVTVHFTAEEKIMEQIGYPRIAEQKEQHAAFTKKVIEESQKFASGMAGVPQDLVHFLRDWLVSHIAVYDKGLADYIHHQRKSGATNLPEGL
ncbi:MAG: bacteriohemerythrin [Treponema sp.]|jgi:hemerythrin|nr:bacteriohemerythrin [Treponema sp.]